MGWMRLCSVDDLSEGAVLPFDVDGRMLMVAQIDGNVYAADRTCTHEDADLSGGFTSPEGVRCPLHLSVFDLSTGRPLNPPAQEPITTYNVKIEQKDVLVEV